MDGIITAAILPYRWGPGWRAVLQNYPRRETRYLERSQRERVIDYPPMPVPLGLHGFEVSIAPWELIRKPNVREYFRATITVTDPAENEVIEEYLIVDPYDLKIEMDKLEAKIVAFMRQALRMGYEIRMREARDED